MNDICAHQFEADSGNAPGGSGHSASGQPVRESGVCSLCGVSLHRYEDKGLVVVVPDDTDLSTIGARLGQPTRQHPRDPCGVRDRVHDERDQQDDLGHRHQGTEPAAAVSLDSDIKRVVA